MLAEAVFWAIFRETPIMRPRKLGAISIVFPSAIENTGGSHVVTIEVQRYTLLRLKRKTYVPQDK